MNRSKPQSAEPSGSALFGCECSGVVRDACREIGVDAWSCDLKPCERGSIYHMQCDVMEAVMSRRRWDMIGLHPDCTKMAVSGNRWYGKGTDLHALRLDAIRWTVALWDEACSRSDHVYLENPVSVVFAALRKRGAVVQYVQPWQFGHGETKRTGFARHGLPELTPTNVVEGREQRVWKMPPSPTRKTDRSRTFAGIGAAIADQWCRKVCEHNAGNDWRA